MELGEVEHDVRARLLEARQVVAEVILPPGAMEAAF